VVQSPGDEETYGNQDTDGSRSVRHFIQPLRQVGAGARKMLETAAAKRWGVDANEVQARFHEVVHTPSGKKLGYGELAADAAALPAPALDTLQLKKPSAFRYIGKGNVTIVDLFDITTGKATYGQDVKLPGMLFAVIARPPVVQGKVASYDDSAAMKVPGVVKVVKIDGTPPPAAFAPLGGVAVIAKNTWAALKGRDALKITWDDGPNASFDSVSYKAMLEDAVRKPGKIERSEGDADAALKSAAKVISAEYYSPHLAHATMEPPSATARMADGKLEISTSVQSPGGARDDCAKRMGLDPEERDLALHAARRRFRPQVEMGLRHRGGASDQGHGRRAIEGGVDARGRHPARLLSHRDGGAPRSGPRQGQQVVAWRHPGAAPSLFANFMPDPKYPQFIELGMGFVDTRSTCRMSGWKAARRSRTCASAGSARSTTWRMPGRSSRFIAEIAKELGRDPGHAAGTDWSGADRGGA
jgi:isoquinoline 1-oxidoreductase beta subunit